MVSCSAACCRRLMLAWTGSALVSLLPSMLLLVNHGFFNSLSAALLHFN